MSRCNPAKGDDYRFASSMCHTPIRIFIQLTTPFTRTCFVAPVVEFLFPESFHGFDKFR